MMFDRLPFIVPRAAGTHLSVCWPAMPFLDLLVRANRSAISRAAKKRQSTSGQMFFALSGLMWVKR
jgi:hypothetical protein